MDDVRLVPFAVSIVLFALTYLGILTEKIHRTVVSLAGAVAMLALGQWLSFYSVDAAVSSIDFNTLTLLMGMMILVRIFKDTGSLEYIAIRATKLAGGRPWLLMIYLGAVTSVLSMVLDNVTTIIILVPVTFSIADILEISPVPFLMGEVMLSNIGGVATLIGDPPNILIGSAAGFSFVDFLVHLAPIVLVVWFVVQGLLLLLYRRQLTQQPINLDRIREIDASKVVGDRRGARRMLYVLGVTILLYLIHDRIGVDPGLVALFGACLALFWLRPVLDDVLQDVHWDVLLFFAALFVVVGGLEAAGVLELLANLVAGLTGQGMVIAALAIFWGAAIMSAVVDNVPFTIAMLPVLAGLAARGLDVDALWWALALGVGFGGNATPVGATANVIAISMSEKTRNPITTRAWLRSGLPTTAASGIIGSLLLVGAIELGLF
jgi:Na+/H+ antiporter NhaD/arsenite permease-like protein